MKTLFVSLRFLAVATLVLGLAYPLAVTGLAQLAFPGQANGSLVATGGKTVGSSLIGQDFSSNPAYFQGRLSAAGGQPYNGLASGGSNLTVVGQPFHDKVAAALKTWTDRMAAAGVAGPVPQELVTASGSGLDPHISLATALFQVPLVAQARTGADPAKLRQLVEDHAIRPVFPWDPPAYVNVLEVNLALDKLAPGGNP